ncbi:EF-hand calcium-binding domain-containing protein 12 isoform X2 [Hyla sarda]|uniref:EF-hand calcium-binding domain-containing protein 12 isoform X2 n=1 Tax=Hyla sarda TaxID=327740 RepID=UPI0024C29E93|nr:EF-hand calcium-binding domain-containing protein 12 isoform X2 [Hyla sarda]
MYRQSRSVKHLNGWKNRPIRMDNLLNRTMAKEVSFQDMRSNNESLRWKQRDMSQTRFFKVACRTFGPPKSRSRRIIAPSMEKLITDKTKEETSVTSTNIFRSQADWSRGTGEPGHAGRSISEQILERQNLRIQLDNMGDVGKWLQGKPELTNLERRVQTKMEERRTESQLSRENTQNMDEEYSVSKSAKHRVINPSIQQPSPEALAILDYYLHQKRIRLVDIYNQTNKSKKKEISSQDLKSVRKEANLPISDLQFDDLVVSLSNKYPNSINYKELSNGRHLWWKKTMHERKKGISVDPAAVKCFLPPSDAQHEPSTSGTPDSLKDYKWRSHQVSSLQSESSKSQFLQVPLVSMDEMRPLSYEDMEEIGKNYRERRRRAQSNTRLLEWLEQCRLVRTGNATVDAHSLPSTLGEEAAELVEQFRRQGLQQYHKILKLCKTYGVPLTEKLLEQALLYPGDKLVCESKEHLQLRQPGTGLRSKYSIKGENNGATSSLERERRDKKLRNSSETCSGPYPPEKYVKWVKRKVRGKKNARMETLKCWTTFEQFEEMSRNLRHRFPHCFYTSDDNMFWPGQILEKLCIYLPKLSVTSKS